MKGPGRLVLHITPKKITVVFLQGLAYIQGELCKKGDIFLSASYGDNFKNISVHENGRENSALLFPEVEQRVFKRSVAAMVFSHSHPDIV